MAELGMIVDPVKSHRKREKLKTKLFEEGLFGVDRKQPVPNSARRIGVITSASGAALHDILAVLERRSPMTEIFLFPVPVQGTDAPEALVRAVDQANCLHQQQHREQPELHRWNGRVSQTGNPIIPILID